ncbi:MAG: DMT family transporter [Pseudomonadota bacterium]
MITNFLILFATSLAWSTSYLFISGAKEIPPITATAVMTAIAAGVILPGVRYILRRPLMQPLRIRPWVPVVMGLTAIALPNLSVVIAEHRITPGLAAVLGTTVPVTTFLLTTFVTRETPFSPLRLLGVPLAVIGLITFVGWHHLTNHTDELFSMLIMMSGGVVFAFNGIFVARQSKDLDKFALTAWTILFGALALSLAAFAIEQPLQTDFSGTLWALAGEGVLGMGLAYLGYYLLVAKAGANFASLYAFLVPPLGAFGSALVLHEPVTSGHSLGVFLVLCGMILMSRQPQRTRLAAASGSSTT